MSTPQEARHFITDLFGALRGVASDAEQGIAVLWDSCPSHPEDGTHECMRNERRCVYCGRNLEPVNCNGCGQFLSIEAMHERESRCEACQ